MAYSLNFTRQALRDLSGINEPNYSKVKQSIAALAENPRPHGYKKLKNRNGYRIRIGDYRVIYDIFDAVLIIDVISIGHRKDVYDR
jgi:mRNA interferase RelE/StbE